MPGHVRVGGAWKDFAPQVRVGGVWKDVDTGYVRVSGVWKEWFSAAPSLQTLVINGTRSNFVLTSHAAFTALDKNIPIEVTVNSRFYATNTGNYAFNVGDLSTWTDVTIIFSSTAQIIGMGGAGGRGSSGGSSGTGTSNLAGGAGGNALNIPSGNTSTILSIQNLGVIYAGGGGGGGGGRGYRQYATNKNCGDANYIYAGGGGGGGGQSGNTGSSGGAKGPGTHTVQTPGAGGGGTVASIGLGGQQGIEYKFTNSTNCGNPTPNAYGGAGATAGIFGSAGSSAGSGTLNHQSGKAGGARGSWVIGNTRATWVGGYGTVLGALG